MLLLQVVFWLSVGLLAWTFIGYPLAVLFLARMFPRPWHEGEFSGVVSMIVAAHNEENVIREKVENCLALDFGAADAEIIVVSDGSTDSTNAILKEFSAADPKLRIITYQPRAGKANALNLGVSQARGEVLIFSDANVMVRARSCQAILSPLVDSRVGAVCGRVLLRARGTDELAGESLYMKYEGVVQNAEASWHSTVGVDGALFAMRRSLFQPLPQAIILDDFMLSMQAPANRLRIVYKKEAEAVEEVIASAENEFRRKARIVAGGYQFLVAFLRSGRSFTLGTWFALFSHKILRWIAPFLLLIVFGVNLALLDTASYRWIIWAQCTFYTLAALGYWVKSLRRSYLVYLPYYFTVVNVAALSGFFRFVTLRQRVLWEKVER